MKVFFCFILSLLWVTVSVTMNQPFQGLDDRSKQLMHAAWSNDTNRVREMLVHINNAPKIGKTKYGVSPICWAMYHGNGPMLRLLLDKGFRPEIETNGATSFHTAAYHGRQDLTRTLIIFPYFANEPGLTLESAAEKQLGLLGPMLKSKTKIAHFDQTPFEAAQEYGHREVADLLAPRGLKERLRRIIIASYQAALADQ